MPSAVELKLDRYIFFVKLDRYIFFVKLDRYMFSVTISISPFVSACADKL